MSKNCNPHPTLQVYREPFAYVTAFKYLGSMVASSSSDFKRRRALAWCAFWKLEKLWRSTTLSIKSKIQLFNTTCITVFLYGCESWVISRDMENKINSFATSCYRVMLNIKRNDHIPNATIYTMTNTKPLLQRVRSQQLKFLGHILCLPDGELGTNIYPLCADAWKTSLSVRLMCRHMQ